MSAALADEVIPADIAVTLVDPACYADHRIHDAYRWLRANNPLGRAELETFDPFWVVTRHADILAISRQNELFHNADRATTLTNKAVLERVHKITGQPNLVRSLVQMDAPDHPKYRALTQGWFMPANIAKFEPRIREIARATVDRMAAKAAAHGGACDFVADVALGYPLHVIMEILGVPEEDEPRMLKLTQELFGPQDPDTARVREGLSAEVFAAMLQAVVADFAAYFERITADRRARPRDDLATVIANARINGEEMPLHDRTSYYMIVATAGHDTTSSSTAGRDLGAGAGSRAVRAREGRCRTDSGTGRRGDPLDDAGQAFHAQRDRRHRARRPADREGRLADAVLRLGKSRRGGV
ncbi:Putative Cytochrome P450 family protein [Bradyrhizobium sp. ORS 278]|nr:Putative Cytochrome P450 family protein [Bradyrhizobium sp. ORS 278]